MRMLVVTSGGPRTSLSSGKKNAPLPSLLTVGGPLGHGWSSTLKVQVATMAPRPDVPAPSHNQLVLVLCSALPLALILCGLCAICRKRRKRRMRTVCAGGVAFVDVTLLRQTQLRSLSKSDTKLHEIKRPPPGDPQLRPVSMDPIYHSPSWHLPATAEDNATYSNLNYTPAPPKSELQKSAGHRGELSNAMSVSRVDEVTAEYAVVRKGKKVTNRGVPESRKEATTQPSSPCLPHRPDDLEIEAMYSKVNKKKKKVHIEENAEGSANMASKCALPPLHSPSQPEENFYESICDMSSHAV